MNFKCEEGFTRGSRRAVGSGVGVGGQCGAWGQKGPAQECYSLKHETQKPKLTKLAESQVLHGSLPPLILTPSFQMRTLRTREGRTGASLSPAGMVQDPETRLGV